MVSTDALRLMEAIYSRTDKQIRDIVGPPVAPEIDTINVIVGDGASPLTAGIGAAIRVDFRSRIVGCFLQEFDGTTGSVAIDVQKAQGGPSPIWVRITPVVSPAIIAGRYFEDGSCSTWDDQNIDRGDYLVFVVSSASTIRRLHIGLCIKRLEP